MEAFSLTEPRLTLAVLAEHVAAPQPTICTGSPRRWSRRDLTQFEDGRYGLGARLLELGGLVRQQLDVVGACSGAIDALAEATGRATADCWRRRTGRPWRSWWWPAAPAPTSWRCRRPSDGGTDPLRMPREGVADRPRAGGRRGRRLANDADGIDRQDTHRPPRPGARDRRRARGGLRRRRRRVPRRRLGRRRAGRCPRRAALLRRSGRWRLSSRWQGNIERFRPARAHRAPATPTPAGAGRRLPARAAGAGRGVLRLPLLSARSDSSDRCAAAERAGRSLTTP